MAPQRRALAAPRIDVRIAPAFRAAVRVAWLRAIARRVLAAEGRAARARGGIAVPAETRGGRWLTCWCTGCSTSWATTTNDQRTRGPCAGGRMRSWQVCLQRLALLKGSTAVYNGNEAQIPPDAGPWW